MGGRAHIGYNLVQFGTIWYNVVQFGTICCKLVLFGTICYNLVQAGAIWYNLVQFGTIWCKLVQFGKISYNLVQFDQIEFSEESGDVQETTARPAIQRPPAARSLQNQARKKGCNETEPSISTLKCAYSLCSS